MQKKKKPEYKLNKVQDVDQKRQKDNMRVSG